MAFVFIMTAIIAYEAGYRNGKQRTIGIFRGTFVAELAGLHIQCFVKLVYQELI